METDYEIFEIAVVIQDFWLIDSESYQRKYATSHGEPLIPGFYVVTWPEYVRLRCFDKQAEFHGPFDSLDETKAMLAHMAKAWQQAVYNIAGHMPATVIKNDQKLVLDLVTPEYLEFLDTVNDMTI